MAVNVVTGQGGTNHISSDNARYANAATFGKGKYVLNIGNKFSATVESPNLVRIMDGMAINQGTQIGIDPDDYEDVGIENGVTGMNRNDIIVMRYIRNDSTSIESGVMEVISGESVSGTPTDPAITSGNILDGKELVDDFPLYRVKVRGLTIEGLDTLFTVWNKDLETYSGDMTSVLATKVDKSAVQSAVNTSTNPVSSNAVRTALASKADTSSVNSALALKADKTETAAIEQEIEDIKAGTLKGALMESVNDVLGAKNLLEITAESQTINGVTFTVDKQAGTITITGTATGASSINICKFNYEAGVSYILTGCPEGGSGTTYKMKANVDASFIDYGSGANVEFSTNRTEDLSILVSKNYSAPSGGLVFRPMLRPAAYESATFAPYAKSNRELTEEVEMLPDNVKKNLLNFDAFAEYANSIAPGAVVNVGSNEYTVEVGSIRQVTEPTIGGAPFRFSNTDIDVTFTITASKGTGSNLIIGLFDTSNECVASAMATNIQNEQMTVSGRACSIAFSFADVGTYTIKNPMIRRAGTSPDFVPYMHSNLELSHMYEGNETYNLLELETETQTESGVTFVANKYTGIITANGTATANIYLNCPVTLAPGEYTLSVITSPATSFTRLGVGSKTGSTFIKNVSANTDYTFTVSQTAQYVVSPCVARGVTASNLTFKPMLRKSTAPAAFVPYRKTNEILTKEIDERWSLSGGVAIPSGADLNNYKTVGNYYCTSTVVAQAITNNPATKAFILKIFESVGVGSVFLTQELREYREGLIFVRTWLDGYWSGWEKRPTRSELDAKLSASDVQTQLLANNKPIASNVVYNLVQADNTSAGRTYIGILMDVYVLIPIGITTYRRNENNSLIQCTDAYATSGSVSLTGQVHKYQNAFLVDLSATYSQSTTPKMGSLVYVTLTGVM